MSGKPKGAPPAAASVSTRALRSNSSSMSAASSSESKVSGKKPRLETRITLPTGSPSTADQLATIEGTEPEGDLKEVKNKIAAVEAEIELIKPEIEKVKDEMKSIKPKIEEASKNAVMDPSPHPGSDFWITAVKQLRDENIGLLANENKLLDKENKLRDEKIRLLDKETQLEVKLTPLLKPQESEPVKKLVGIAKLAKSMNAPSSYAKLSDWPNVKSIYHHRPPGSAHGALHVSLFSAAMGEFRSKCENFAETSKSEEACVFVQDLCTAMRKVYDNEADRQDCFNDILNAFLTKKKTGYTCSPVAGKLQSDGSIIVLDSNPKLMLLNVEIKNEKGLTGSDCVMQNLAYFVKFWGALNLKDPYPPIRSFLLSLEGCVLYVHGAVWVKDKVHSDELCPPLTLLLQHDMPRNIDRIVVWADALLVGLKKLHHEMIVDQPPDPNFPYLVELNGLKFKYEREIKRRVFLAELEDSDQKVVVKFSPHGNAVGLHKLLAKNGFAPKLLAHGIIESTWHVSVMEYTPDKEEQVSLTKEQKDQLTKAVTLMHDNGWVHGDLRDPNILCVGETQRIHIIDFEFSGREGEVVYPSLLNMTDIKWPKGVAPGCQVMKEHDAQMLEWICED